MRGPFGPLRRTIRGTRVSLRQEHCKKHSLHYGLSEGEASIARDQAWIVRSLKNQKTLKVTGSEKCIFRVLMDRPGCTAGPSATALSDI
jgi:hypothetical protein